MALMKTELNDLCQSKKILIEGYNTVKTFEGFISTLKCGSQTFTSAKAHSTKKAAENDAAMVALKALRSNHSSSSSQPIEPNHYQPLPTHAVHHHQVNFSELIDPTSGQQGLAAPSSMTTVHLSCKTEKPFAAIQTGSVPCTAIPIMSSKESKEHEAALELLNNFCQFNKLSPPTHEITNLGGRNGHIAYVIVDGKKYGSDSPFPDMVSAKHNANVIALRELNLQRALPSSSSSPSSSSLPPQNQVITSNISPVKSPQSLSYTLSPVKTNYQAPPVTSLGLHHIKQETSPIKQATSPAIATNPTIQQPSSPQSKPTALLPPSVFSKSTITLPSRNNFKNTSTITPASTGPIVPKANPPVTANKITLTPVSNLGGTTTIPATTGTTTNTTTGTTTNTTTANTVIATATTTHQQEQVEMNYKPILNEFSQKNKYKLPEYDIEYPNDCVGFVGIVELNGVKYRSNVQKNKKSAQNMAAYKAALSLNLVASNKTSLSGINDMEMISYKNKLQEHFQKQKTPLPSYSITQSPNGYFICTITCYTGNGGEVTLKGSQQTTKKAAEQSAAREACLKFKF
jgi:dsRNA-specific ribonuclease